ncbi:hypothetical protein HYALB_00009139 [Hymenoscyphus albidus]|uniref:Uncharacterized protein n=1 Tax=Hymenoscyphus albidus TaxID=595503 RepID=A0A9N9Q896_9HELO|nr:hypothetical protein HYALB_00009139 [Hymenoscyphus albidus]
MRRGIGPKTQIACEEKTVSLTLSAGSSSEDIGEREGGLRVVAPRKPDWMRFKHWLAIRAQYDLGTMPGVGRAEEMIARQMGMGYIRHGGGAGGGGGGGRDRGDDA